MAKAAIYGWDDANSAWVKVECDADGKLELATSALFENPPTEDEDKKGPSSEWAYDHAADAAAHHAKFTAAEARAAINDIFGADGKADKHIDMHVHNLTNIMTFTQRNYNGSVSYFQYVWDLRGPYLRLHGLNDSFENVDFDIEINTGSGFVKVVRADSFQTNMALFLENPPTEDEAEKAPTSEWAHDHKADAAAHHAKYTDLEAQTACNLNGTLYASWPGVIFGAQNPDTDEVYKGSTGYIRADANGIVFCAAVNLPNGATITGVIVYGNAAAEAETWTLRRVTLSGGATVTMATAVFNTEDTSIDYDTVDNSLYSYAFGTTTMDTDDIIYGIRITFTL